MQKIIVVLIIFVISKANIWDNILSEMEATSPIIPTNSFNFDFDIPQYGSQGNIDFNQKLQILTIVIYKDALVMNLQFFRMELYLKTLTAYTKQFLIGCQNLKLAFVPNDSSKKLLSTPKAQNKITKQNLFLVNVLFKFIGFHKEGNLFSKKQYNLYQFQYDLNDKTKSVMDKQEFFDEQLDIKDKIQMLNFVLLVDDKGQIIKAYSDKTLKKQLKLSDSSKLLKPSECDAQVKQITVQDLKNLLKAAFNNKQMIMGGLEDLSSN